MYGRIPLIFFSFCTCVCSLTAATLTNITVDDSTPDPSSGQVIQYIPDSLWNVGQDCRKCTARPQANRTHDSTWHDTTHDPNQASSKNQFTFMVFNFVGTAVYLYGILGFDQGSASAHFVHTTQLLLTIDKQSFPPFSFTPSGRTDFTYDAPLFVVDSLPHGPHTMIVQNGIPNTNMGSLLMVDKLVYTTDINATSTASATASRHSTSNHGVMAAAGVLGGLLGLVAASTALFFCRRQRLGKRVYSTPNVTANATPPDRSITPYTMEQPHAVRDAYEHQSQPPAGTSQLQGLTSAPSFSATPPPYPASEMDRLAAGDAQHREPSGAGSAEVSEDASERRVGKLGRLRV